MGECLVVVTLAILYFNFGVRVGEKGTGKECIMIRSMSGFSI